MHAPLVRGALLATNSRWPRLAVLDPDQLVPDAGAHILDVAGAAVAHAASELMFITGASRFCGARAPAVFSIMRT